MNGGGRCAVCGANQGAYDEVIGLPRCKGELAHPMYYFVPVPKAAMDRLQRDLLQGEHFVKATWDPDGPEYPTADRPVSKRNPSWTF